jgi:hypothetical protein
MNVDGGPEYIGGVFSLLLRCASTNCGENVFCIGTYHLTEYAAPPDPSPNYVPAIKPQFFTPTIRIFPISKDLPEKIAKPLLDSFSLFWSNPSAAGNALRVAIEALMDYRCVKKWIKDKHGKEVSLSLHNRILEFKKTNPELGDKLLALKWLGNGGSHLSGLATKDMVDAYRLMEFVLDQLFNKTHEELDQLTKKINKRKKAV